MNASALDATGPNLFVVGAAKSGTTSLWAQLDAHPEIYMSHPKEPHYFSRARVPVDQLVKSPTAYAELFAGGANHRYRGDASTSYLWDPESPARIRQAAPGARIVISLRDPVERAYANYLGHLRVGFDKRPFSEVVRTELADGDVDLAAVPAPHVARGFYDEQVARYLQAFGDATLVLLFDELIADVRGTMRTVFEWLGVDVAPAETLDPAPVYPFLMPRNASVAALRRVPVVRRAANVVVRGPLRKRIDRVVFNVEKPPLDPEIRRLLREVYAPHDARLRQLLGRSLPWDGRE
jgi:sulfotransferase family protein